MYKILIDGNYIFDDATNLEEYKLIKPKLTLAVNQAGSLSFKLPPSNRGYDEEGVLNKQVLVLKNGDALWYGRVMTESVDIWGNRDIYCEGELSFLNDTHQPQGRWQNMSIEGFLTQLINVHNSHVAASKQFRVGNVTVTDPDLSPESTIYRFTNWETTWDCIQDKLLDRFGGYLQVRYVNNVRYLDYLAAIPTVGGQNITFGKNLLDFTRNFDANDIKTVIVPFGTALDEEAVEGLTAYLDVKSVNGGSPYVYNQSAVNEFGWVEEVVHWDDVTQPANLLRNAHNYLQDVQYEKMIIDLNAFDLNRIDPDIPSLECGELVYVQSDVHNLHRNFLVSKVVLQLDDPGQDEYVLGAESKTVLFSDSVQTEIQKNYKRTEQKGNDISNLKQAAITDVEVYYAQGNSATEAPSSGWSPVAPVWENGKYMWQYTHTRKANGTDDDSDPTNITGAKGDKGDDGDSGVSVTSSEEQYYLSTSSSEPIGGSWSTSVPAYISGRYYWTRIHTTFSDGTTSDSVPALNQGLTDANQRAALADNKADNISRGLITNYYTKTDVDQGMQELEGEILSTVSNSYVDQTTYATDIDNLQQQIDGAIETFTGSAVPTLNNYPASDWNTDAKKDQHIGDLYLVNSSGGSQAGFYYRFEKNNSTYSWVHVPDSDVQKALADAAAANAAAIAAQGTADGIAEDLQQNYYTSTQTESAIDQKADDILLQVGSTYATQSTVTNVKNSTIKSDVLHYLATSAGSGVTRSTPGWTTTVQSMTETNQYLWTYHTYTYGDDHTSDTDPIITGRYGQNGSQGPQGPTGPQGPQGSQGNPGDDGISIVEVIPLKYAGSSTTAPAAPTSNVTRTDAATGVWTRGVPALTNTYKYMYTCDQVKYSDNTYTWTSVVLDNAITNLTQRMTQAELDLQPDSITAKVSSTNTFTTLQQFNALEIGGTNLIRNTHDFKGAYINVPARASIKTDEPIPYIRFTETEVTWNNVKLYPNVPIELINGKTVTVSAEVRANEVMGSIVNGIVFAINGYSNTETYGRSASKSIYFNTNLLSVGEWVKLSYTIDINLNDWNADSGHTIGEVKFFSLSLYDHAGKSMDFRHPKLEIGNKVTDWSPAPEDIETNSVNTAKSYTDAQLQITSSSILSTVEEGYTTKTEFNSLSIGGENVLEYSKNFELVNTNILTQQGAITTNAEGFTEAEQRGNGTSWIENYMRLYLDATDKGLVGKDVTISFDFKTNDITKIGNMFCSWGSHDASGVRVGDINIAINSYKTVDGSTLANNKWTRIYYTFRVETIANNSRYYIIQFKINSSIPSGTSMYYRKPKVEIGNRPTDWSPALYDIQPVGTNLLRYAPKSKTPTNYQALQLDLTEKLVKGQTYTLQLWDIDISHTGKQASELNVSVFAGGGNNLLATITGFTNGHADYKVVTFTVSVNPNQPTHLDNLWLNIYNSVPNASGTLNLTIGSWKLEKGNKATEWQMNPIDASSKSEVQQLSNMVAVKVNSSGRLVTAALGVDPASSTSYVKVKADDIDIIANGNIQLTGKSIGITSTNFSVTAAGSITAKAGTIGGWSIDSEKLYKSGTASGITYASYLKANELKISVGLSGAELEQTIVKSGYIQLIGQGSNPMKNIIIDGAGEESPGTGIGYIQTPRLVTSLIEPQVDNEVNIAGALLCNSNKNCYMIGSLQLGSASSSLNCGIDIFGGGNPYIDFHLNHSSADFTARIVHRTAGNTNYIDFIASSSVWIDCRAKSFTNQSSKYVKDNIKDISDEEAKKILELRPVSFDYKYGGDPDQRGLIAEEVYDILPNMVIGAPKEFNAEEPWDTPSIDYSKFVPYLIKMIQVQQREIDILKSK